MAAFSSAMGKYKQEYQQRASGPLGKELYTGVLTKSAGKKKHKGWDERFFVVDMSYFKYWKTEREYTVAKPEKFVKGTVEWEDVEEFLWPSTNPKAEEFLDQGAFDVVISLGGGETRTMTLYAETKADSSKWYKNMFETWMRHPETLRKKDIEPPGDPPAAPAPPDIPSFDTLAVESTFKVGKKAADHEVITAAIGPAGIVYLGCESDGLSFWDLGSKAMVDGEDDAAVSCTATYINDDRTMLYSGYDACVFRVWELDGSGAPGPIATVATGPTEGVKWLKPDYESNMLYVGVGGAVQVWSLDWELVTTLQGHGYISTIAWADGFVYTAEVGDNKANTVIKVWDTAEWKITALLKGHTNCERRSDIVIVRGNLLSAAADGHICRWDLSNNKLVARSETYGPLNCFHVNTEKGIIFTGGEDSFHIWTWNLERKVSIPIEGSVDAISVTQGNVVILAAGDDVVFYGLPQKSVLFKVVSHKASPIHFRMEGDTLFSWGRQSKLNVTEDISGYIARAGRDIEGRAQIKDRYEARLAEYEEENAAFTETLAEYDEKVANFNRLTTIAT